MTVGQSAREARIAVNYSMQGELIDWAVPVVYARDPNMTLCQRPETVSVVPATSMRATSRRATTGRPMRVAVWDIDDVFPSLDRTLERMNAAQSVFGFELVDMSTPLDVWDLDDARERRHAVSEGGAAGPSAREQDRRAARQRARVRDAPLAAR